MVSRAKPYFMTWKPTSEEIAAAYALMELRSVREVGTLRSGRCRKHEGRGVTNDSRGRIPVVPVIYDSGIRESGGGFGCPLTG